MFFVKLTPKLHSTVTHRHMKFRIRGTALYSVTRATLLFHYTTILLLNYGGETRQRSGSQS
jgi:hypothetical protein